jgi:hypothetical protein
MAVHLVRLIDWMEVFLWHDLGGNSNLWFCFVLGLGREMVDSVVLSCAIGFAGMGGVGLSVPPRATSASRPGSADWCTTIK